MLSGIPLWIQATLWGLLGGSALLIGAAIGYFADDREPPALAALRLLITGALAMCRAPRWDSSAGRSSGGRRRCDEADRASRDHLPERLVAAIMAFGSGVLISALAFELMDEAYSRGGFLSDDDRLRNAIEQSADGVRR